MTTLGSDFKPTPRKDRDTFGEQQADTERVPNQRLCKSVRGNESTISSRARSLEVSQRLIGSVAFQVPNRHRHCKGKDCGIVENA